MKSLFIAFVMLLAGPVFAENTMGLHTFSWHSGGGCVNNENPGAYVQINDGATFGTYLNSCDRQTFYVGGEFLKHNLGPVQVAGFAMAATGYFMPVTPGAFLTLKMPFTNKDAVRLAGHRWQDVTVLHLSVERKF